MKGRTRTCRTLDGANRWPAEEPVFREVLERYLKKVERVAFALTGAFAAGLGLPPRSLDHLFQPHHSAFLRLNYYPPRTAREGPLAAPQGRSGPHNDPELGIHPHKDAGFLTVLLQVCPRSIYAYLLCFFEALRVLNSTTSIFKSLRTSLRDVRNVPDAILLLELPREVMDAFPHHVAAACCSRERIGARCAQGPRISSAGNARNVSSLEGMRGHVCLSLVNCLWRSACSHFPLFASAGQGCLCCGRWCTCNSLVEVE